MSAQDDLSGLFAQLDDIPAPPDDEVLNVSLLSTDQLTLKLHALDDALMELGQLYARNPKGEARELHSQRAALVVEINNRRNRGA